MRVKVGNEIFAVSPQRLLSLSGWKISEIMLKKNTTQGGGSLHQLSKTESLLAKNKCLMYKTPWEWTQMSSGLIRT